MSVLTRYTIREIGSQLAGVFAVVLTIFVVRRFGALLQEAAEGSVGLMVTLQLLGLRTIMALPSLFPVAFYASVLLAISRLSLEQELIAMSACGISPLRMQRSVITFAVFVAIGIGLVGFSVRPWAATRYDALRHEAAAGLELGSLVPGRFYSISSADEYVVFAETRSPTKQGFLQNVFVQQRKDDQISILYADEAVEYRNEEDGFRFLRLLSGSRYDFREDRRNYETTQFGELILRAPLSPMVAAEPREEGLPTSALLNSSSPKYRAEFQWRMAMPVAALILALFALPFGRVDPRHGRSMNVFFAILVYVAYRNLLGMAKNWVEDGDLAPFPGIWLVHGAALMAAVPLLIRDWRRG